MKDGAPPPGGDTVSPLPSNLPSITPATNPTISEKPQPPHGRTNGQFIPVGAWRMMEELTAVPSLGGAHCNRPQIYLMHSHYGAACNRSNDTSKHAVNMEPSLLLQPADPNSCKCSCGVGRNQCTASRIYNSAFLTPSHRPLEAMLHFHITTWTSLLGLVSWDHPAVTVS